MATTVILFDIDGTLLLTGGAGSVVFNHIFEKLYQIENAWGTIHPDGRTDISLIKECFQNNLRRLPTQSEIENITKLYCDHLSEILKTWNKFRLMPCVPELLESLAIKSHITLGLATGNFKASAFHKLEKCGIAHHFKFGGYGCDSENRLILTQKAVTEAKNLLKKNDFEIYLVGDTTHDILCGQAIGAKTIAVCTGSTQYSDLKNSGADFVIRDLSKFPEI